MKRFAWKWLGVLLYASLGLGVASAAILDEARLVAASESLASSAPASESFTIATAGSYALTLTDLGEQGGIANAFSFLSVVVSQGGRLVKLLSVPANASSISAAVSLAVGQYQVQVLGLTTGASQYGAELRSSGNVLVWGDVGTITAPPANNINTLQQPLSLTPGQSYTVTLTDQVFPQALSQLQLSVFETGASSPAGNCNLQAGGTCSFIATGTSALLTVLATEANASAGLYSVNVTNTTTASVLYAASLPVGDMPEPVTVNFPAADSYALTSIDFQTPTALTTFKLALVQGAQLLARQTVSGAAPGFTAASDAANLYVIATPATNSAGLYGVDIKRGSTTVFGRVTPVDDAVDAVLDDQVFTVTLPNTGTYELKLGDFSFPNPFTQLRASVIQNGVLLNTLTAPGSLNINAQAGELVVAVLATPGAGGAGLFGITLKTDVGTALLETTRGVGGRFNSEVVSLTTGPHALTATDFFTPPAQLDSLVVVLTRGLENLGTIYAGGTVPFQATAGDYTLNYITKVKTNVGYGMVGVTLVRAPVITLSASPNRIGSGGSSTLSWSATDTTTCTASGGWSGSRPSTGTVVISAITGTTTFILTCTNAAGSSEQSTTVTVSAEAAASGGGGGAWSFTGLFGLGLLACARDQRLGSRRGD